MYLLSRKYQPLTLRH